MNYSLIALIIITILVAAYALHTNKVNIISLDNKQPNGGSENMVPKDTHSVNDNSGCKNGVCTLQPNKNKQTKLKMD